VQVYANAGASGDVTSVQRQLRRPGCIHSDESMAPLKPADERQSDCPHRDQPARGQLDSWVRLSEKSTANDMPMSRSRARATKLRHAATSGWNILMEL